MFRRIILLALLLAGNAATGSEIREFSVPTLEKLGREISQRDEIAARAADLVLQTQPAAKVLKMRGWITDLGKDEDKVYLIADTPSGTLLAYAVGFPRSGKPQVEDKRGQPLPPDIALRYKARQTAIAALAGRFFDAQYNFEVLFDPDGSGFLVYALASTNKPGEQITGGHFRVTVSSDGSTAERVDALSRGIIRDTPKLPKGATQEAMVSTQLVSNVPVETFIYTSYLYHLPIYVGTMDRAVWRVVNGKIEKMDPALVKETGKAEKKKTKTKK